MPAVELFSADGERLELGRLIGRGGEGEVYAIKGANGLLVKRYTLKDLASREAKVARMVRGELHRQSNLIAFPIAPVRDRQGRFAGFTMQKVDDHQPLHELYAPGARKAAFPSARYPFLVHAAGNIARVVAMAHKSGCVIGDINHSGILVSKKATAALIDADSFQVMEGDIVHFCKVGIAEYTPPELQGLRLDGIKRTTTHDEFGLAIAIFQLLWMGRHPYSGRYTSGEMPIEKAIKEFRFVYSKARNVGMSAPPGAPSLADILPSMAQAFEQAFGPQGVGARPTAAQWSMLLDDFEKDLKPCEQNSLHHHSSHAHDCPWCRMERGLHVQLFLPPFARAPISSAAAVNIVGEDLAAIWRAIESVAAPPPAPALPPLPTLSWRPSQEVQQAKHNAVRSKFGGAVVLIAAIALWAAAPGFFLIWLAGAWWGAALLFGSGTAQHDQMLKRYRDIETQWQRALTDWRDRCGDSRFTETRASLKAIKTEIEGLPQLEQKRIKAYYDNRRTEQLNQFLEGFQIRRTKIDGIGPAKLTNLTSYGIETAADVTQGAVLRVPGFGPVNSQPLLKWRKQIEAKFIYNGSPTPADQNAIAAIKADLANRSDELRKRLKGSAQSLAQLAADIVNKRNAPDPVLMRLHTQREQVVGDLKALGVTPPPVHVPPPTPAYSSNSKWSAPSGRTYVSCPRCHRRMIVRTAGRGANAGNRFYGCSSYPRCRGTRPYP